jgi:threonine dehydrogenase-like Zn-dependent dehydrogenase
MKSILVLGIAGEVLPAYASALDLMVEHLGRLPLRGIVTHRMGLDQAGQAIELSQSADAMKVVLDPRL